LSTSNRQRFQKLLRLRGKTSKIRSAAPLFTKSWLHSREKSCKMTGKRKHCPPVRSGTGIPLPRTRTKRSLAYVFVPLFIFDGGGAVRP
jgi:hypothetical protein